MAFKGRTAKSPKKGLAQGPTNVKRSRDTTVGVKLPIAYLTILETEASFFEATRSQFLSMLLKRKHGVISFERPRGAPDYKFPDKDLRETKLYLWYLSPDLRQKLDADRLQMGRLGSSAWIVTIINDWLGRPKGLRSTPQQP